jgi:hypothetical protein
VIIADLWQVHHPAARGVIPASNDCIFGACFFFIYRAGDSWVRLTCDVSIGWKPCQVWYGQVPLGDLCVPGVCWRRHATRKFGASIARHLRPTDRVSEVLQTRRRASGEIVKGYPDQSVGLSQNELEPLRPSDDKTIYFEHFLDPLFVDRKLWESHFGEYPSAMCFPDIQHSRPA